MYEIPSLLDFCRRHGHKWRGAVTYLRLMGWRATKRRILSELYPSRSKDYESWLARYGTLTGDEISAIGTHIAALAWRPRISIVMHAHNTPAGNLRSSLDSVIDQCYPDWELCVVDDGSTTPDVAEVLKEYTQREGRIRTTARPQRGGAALAGNTALEMVTGDFVAVLGDADVLARHALYMVAVELNEHPETDIVYSDEDEIDAGGDVTIPGSSRTGTSTCSASRT